MRFPIPLLLICLFVVACSSSSSGNNNETLELQVNSGEASIIKYLINCSDNKEFCDLTVSGAFEADSDILCTMQYFGPETATLSGVYRQQDIALSFARNNGCAESLWNSLANELGTLTNPIRIPTGQV